MDVYPLGQLLLKKEERQVYYGKEEDRSKGPWVRLYGIRRNDSRPREETRWHASSLPEIHENIEIQPREEETHAPCVSTKGLAATTTGREEARQVQSEPLGTAGEGGQEEYHRTVRTENLFRKNIKDFDSFTRLPCSIWRRERLRQRGLSNH